VITLKGSRGRLSRPLSLQFDQRFAPLKFSILRGTGRIEMLRRAAQFAVVFLIVGLVAMPVMACMVQEREMTAEEHNCCKKMAHACESSAMPASHSCCQHPVLRQVASVSKIWTGDFELAPSALVHAPFTLSSPQAHSDIVGFNSPPGSPPQISTVLRI